MSHDDPDERPEGYAWLDGRLVSGAELKNGAFDGDADAFDGEAQVRKWLEEARQLSRRCLESTCETRSLINNQYIQAYFEYLKPHVSPDELESSIDKIDVLFSRLSLLPVGNTHARFDLSILTDEDTARLTIALRTTEDHIETGEPEMNLLGFPIPKADAQVIESHYKASGEPTLRIARVIDVGGAGVSEAGLKHGHLFWFSYGPWESIQPITTGASGVLHSVTDKEALNRRLRDRLAPNAVQKLEEEVFADGKALATSVLEWLDKPATWIMDGAPIDVGRLIEQLRVTATTLADPQARTRNQHDVARAGLVAIYGESIWIDRVLDEGFRALTDPFSPAERRGILAAMALTGRAPASSVVLDDLATDLAAELPIFFKTNFGWDISCPAHQGGKNENAKSFDR